MTVVEKGTTNLHVPRRELTLSIGAVLVPTVCNVPHPPKNGNRVKESIGAYCKLVQSVKMYSFCLHGYAICFASGGLWYESF